MAADSPLVRHLGELARHMAWADASVWNAVLATPHAAGDARIGDTLHHIHLVQHIFLQGWTQAPFAARERAEFMALDSLAAWGREAHRGVQAFIDATDSEALDREFRVPWAARFEQHAGRPAGVHTLGESLMQVVLHTQHHRGQVCSRLRETGAEPPTVDLIVWLWAGRPSPSWDVELPPAI